MRSSLLASKTLEEQLRAIVREEMAQQSAEAARAEPKEDTND
ncbi:MAG: hypothetical protein ACRCS9_08830 [Hyphomicrobium sp.]